MAVKFNPTGSLDLASDPADLPSQNDGKMEVSGAMQRCTNLHLDRLGIAATRRGSAKLNATAISTPIHRIIEQAGKRFTFAGTSIYEDEGSIGSGYTSAPWSAVLYNSYATTVQSVFALNGTDRKRIDNSTVKEWGSESPTVAPVLSVGDSTGLTGDYNAKYTWARKEGTTVVWESNPSPAGAAPVTLADQSLQIEFTLPTDTQITHVRIYRTLTDGSVYYHDQDISINTAEYDFSYFYVWEIPYASGDGVQAFTPDLPNKGIVTYTWELAPAYAGTDTGLKASQPWEVAGLIDTNTDDGSLGTEAYWTDHDRPPLGTVVLGPGFAGVVFIIKDNNLYYCLPNQPEYWPSTYYIEVSPVQTPLKAGCFLSGQLLIASTTEIYAIQGTGPGTFSPLAMGAQTGAVNSDCFVAATGYGVFHLGNDGIYQYAGGKDQLITRGQFEPIFRGETRGNVPGLNRTYIANCWMAIYHGKLYLGYPGGASEYPDNMLVMDLGTNRTVHHSYAAYFKTIAVDSTNNRLLAGDTSGYVWQWDNVDLTDDGGTAIAWQIQSKDFNQLRKYFPRYAKYDVNVGTGGSAAGYIIADDVSKQTHTLTGDRNTRKRLVAGCTGDRMAVRLAGSGSVKIFGVEIE